MPKRGRPRDAAAREDDGERLRSMERRADLPLGVVVERRAIDHPWQKWRWRPVAVIPGAPPPPAAGQWTVLAQGEGWARFHAGTLPLGLHRRETEAYRTNLSARQPVVFVVLRPQEDAPSERAYRPVAVTASPYEAQDHLDGGDDLVEGVPMPDEVVAWVQGFIDRHHVDEPFRKRRREGVDPDRLGPRGRGGGGPPNGRGGRGLG